MYLNHYDEEVRCGYRVTEMRKRLWDAELSIYRVFSDICEKYQLKHFLIYGSALGAIRHQGFIPWDDDMDMGMYRDDFEKFLAVAEKELPPAYSVTYGLLDNKLSPLLRIRDGNTTGIIRGEQNSSCNKGVFIEVYVFDHVPAGERERKEQIGRVESLSSLINQKYQKNVFRSKDALATFLKTLSKSKQALFDELTAECKRYHHQTDHVNCVMATNYGKSEELLFPKAMVDEIETVPYENTTVCVLKDSDTMLRQAYGDYMQLPPEEERGKNHQTIVYYDPTKPYTEYENSEILSLFFDGKDDGLLG